MGALNTAFGYAAFAALVLLGVHYAAAALVSTVLGILFNFQTTGRLVFGHAGLHLLPRFLLVYAGVYGANVLGLAAAERIGVGPLVAGAVLLLPLALLAYTAQKRFVFSAAR